MIPSALLSKAAVYGMFVAIGFVYGYHVADKGKQALVNQLEADVQLQEQQADIALAHWEQERAEREHYQDQLQARLQDVTKRPDYQRMCLDDDGLRIANDALKGSR